MLLLLVSYEHFDALRVGVLGNLKILIIYNLEVLTCMEIQLFIKVQWMHLDYSNFGFTMDRC